MTTKEDAISVRRGRVAELLAKGYNQAQIAKELKSSEPTISRDVEELRQTAIKNVESHVEGLPHAWETSKLALEGLIRKANDLLDSNELEAGEQLDIIKTLADLCIKRLDIHTSPAIMKRSIEHIQKLKQKINLLKKDQGAPYEVVTLKESVSGGNPKLTKVIRKKKPAAEDEIIV